MKTINYPEAESSSNQISVSWQLIGIVMLEETIPLRSTFNQFVFNNQIKVLKAVFKNAITHLHTCTHAHTHTHTHSHK